MTDDERVNDEQDSEEEDSGFADAMAGLMAHLMGAMVIREMKEPEPVENGIARFIREFIPEHDDEGDTFRLYQMDPPFGKHEHVIASTCNKGCCAHIIPVHEDSDWEFGFRPCGGHEGAMAWSHITTVHNSSLAACFARYGYTVAEEA